MLETPPKDKALPSIAEGVGPTRDKAKPSGENEEAHVADMNKFMAHIGVRYLFVIVSQPNRSSWIAPIFDDSCTKSS
jgi:hypothetical protein